MFSPVPCSSPAAYFLLVTVELSFITVGVAVPSNAVPKEHAQPTVDTELDEVTNTVQEDLYLYHESCVLVLLLPKHTPLRCGCPLALLLLKSHPKVLTELLKGQPTEASILRKHSPYAVVVAVPPAGSALALLTVQAL